MNRKIIGYVVSGPAGNYDHETDDLAEAYDVAEAMREEHADGGVCLGLRLDDGSVTFDIHPGRPRQRRAA